MSKWISVKDSLPKNFSWTLVVTETFDPLLLDTIVSIDKCWFAKDFVCHTLNNVVRVTHWMPLPELPE